jgi:serine/threonine protein kinase
MRVSPTCAMLGTKILHYQLLDRIGAGGMGEIYKAQDTRLNRLVAVKLLSPGLSTDPDRKRRFFQEAQAASALNHPNIITLYDIVSEGDLQCIVMEYIAGKTLRELTPARGLPPAQALQYAAQIASALTAAHDAHIIHRDLKPSNIMVNSSGLIKVLDFGLAKWVDSSTSAQSSEQSIVETALTREGSIIGTVSYMSPEQAEGKHVDARSDIFSFGSVLYEMVTGKRAFEGRSGISTLSSILRDDVKPIYEAAPDVPPLLEQIVLRCLPKDPASRWQSMKEIEVALLNLQRQLDPEGRFAPPIPTTPMPVGSTRRAPLSSMQEASSAAAPTLVSSVSTASDPFLQATPVAAAPPNGPSRPPTELPRTTADEFPLAGTARNPQVVRPPLVPPRVVASSVSPPPARRPTGSSNKLLVVVLGLLGAVLVAGAGIGGWLWWKGHRSAEPPGQTQISAAIPTVPSIPKPSPAPVEATQPPAENPPSAPSAGSNTNASKAKPKHPPKAKQDKTANILPPALPPPVTPILLPPVPVTVAPTPPPPKPVIQTTPIMVSDALPLAITLAEDVPLDAPEGETVHFIASEELQVNEKIVIAKGAAVTGAIAGGTGKKKFLGLGGGRKLTFLLSQVDAVDGRKLTVRALAGKSEDGATVRPFDTGKGSKPKGYAAMKGTSYIAYVDGDQMVAVGK